jgi:hypothetical protein
VRGSSRGRLVGVGRAWGYDMARRRTADRWPSHVRRKFLDGTTDMEVAALQVAPVPSHVLFSQGSGG